MIAIPSQIELSEEAMARRFERLCQDARPRAMSFARQLTRNQPDADDLVQAALVKAWRRFDTFQDDRPFHNWLLRIVQRTYLDSLRSSAAKAVVFPLDGLKSQGGDEVMVYDPKDPQPGPEEQAEQGWLHEQITAALADMPAIYSRPIEMCEFEDMSYEDIAEAEGISASTVRSRLHRGRQMLRESLRRRGVSGVKARNAGE